MNVPTQLNQVMGYSEERTKPIDSHSSDKVLWLILSMDRTNKTEKRRDKHNKKIYNFYGAVK